MSEQPRLHSIPGGLAERAETPSPQPVHALPGDGPVRSARLPESRGERPRALRPVREPLWREVLGAQLRALRQEQGEKLVETAGRAGISPQYLSEVERGRKEPSSEMIAALAGALGTDLIGLTQLVATELRRQRMESITRPTAQAFNGPVMLAA
ncbi:helix-turn-helix domain-containing protein [Nocardia sp. NBC_01503]|uniref:helix-turn-helix domain-containing protein n=1 Tax=Nocardia sp. NBC_01503 TaxID=2975997 RepID=UPI003FA60404